MKTETSMYAFMRESITRDTQEKIYYYGNRIRAKEFLANVDAAAAFLQKIGIEKGDSVGICLPNIPQAAIALYAVNKIGAIANVIHPKTGTEALKEIIERTATKAVFIFDRFLKSHTKIQGVAFIYCRMSDYFKGVKKLFRLIEPVCRGNNRTSWKELLKYSGAQEYVADGRDAAVYLHSSGTTGAPKTVVLSSYAFNELAQNCFDTVKHLCEVKDDISILMVLPLFHGFGLGICVHLAMHKGRSVMIPLFNPKKTVKLMQKEPINVIPGVPGMFRHLYEDKGFKGEFLKNIKLIFCGGDKLPAELKTNFENRLKEYGCLTPIMEGYGMSEVASVATINVFAPDNGSLGQGIKNVKLKIVNDGRECGPYEEGEIYISSPSAMDGYSDGKTTAVSIDGEKWIPSGDIGYLDENGCLFYKERIKRIAKISGVNVFPAEVEDTALRYKGVKKACVARITYEGKPALKIIVVSDRKDGRFCDGLKEFIKTELTPYAVPKIVEFATDIKTSAIGKADYRFYEEHN